MNKLFFHLSVKSHRLSSRKRDLLHSTHHLNKKACLRFSANVKHDFYTKINKDTLFLTMIQTQIKALMKFKRQLYLFQRYMLTKGIFYALRFHILTDLAIFTSFLSQMRKPLHFLLLIISLFRVNADRKVTFFHLSSIATQLKARLKHLGFFFSVKNKNQHANKISSFYKYIIEQIQSCKRCTMVSEGLENIEFFLIVFVYF